MTARDCGTNDPPVDGRRCARCASGSVRRTPGLASLLLFGSPSPARSAVIDHAARRIRAPGMVEKNGAVMRRRLALVLFAALMAACFETESCDETSPRV